MDSVEARLWESLRNDARLADQQLDQQLSHLEDVAKIDESSVTVDVQGKTGRSPAVSNVRSSKLSSHGSLGSSSVPTLRDVSIRFDATARQAEDGLRHLEHIVLSMNEATRGNLGATKHAERYHSILAEKRSLLNRIISDFRRRRERMELLPTVAVEVHQYEQDAGTRLLMEEQAAIHHAHGRVSQIIEQGTSAQSRLMSQRDRFHSVSNQLVQIMERVPLIQSVLRRIDARRRREVVVLGTLMSVMMFMVVLFW